MKFTLIAFLISLNVLALSPELCNFNLDEKVPGPNSILQKIRNQIALNKTPDELKKSLDELQDSINKYIPEGEQDEAMKWFYANIFYDRDMIVKASGKSKKDFLGLWDETRHYYKYIFFRKKHINSPLDNYIRAYDELVLQNPDRTLDFDFIKEAHTILMKSSNPKIKTNIEGIPDIRIGEIRPGGVMFRGGDTMAAKVKKSNPYLTINRRTTPTQIEYPSVDKIDDLKHRMLSEDFERIKALPGSPASNYAKKNKEFVKALLDFALEEHNAAIKVATNVEERITAHANLAWNYINIHPFANGNGRSGRFILHKLLADEGLLPPILNGVDDILTEQSLYAKNVLEGVKNSYILKEEMIMRARTGLDYQGTPLSMAPLMPGRVKLKDGTKYADEDYFTDLFDYAQFYRRHGHKFKTENESLKAYVAHVKKYAAFHKNNKEGLTSYQIKYVPDEFKDLHFKNQAHQTDLWDYKMNNFYRDQDIYRGLGTHASYSDDQLAQFFIQNQNIFNSMKSSKVSGDIQQSVVNDFDEFNKLVDNPNRLVKYADDHMKAQGTYSQSILASTSKNKATAVRFSKGFLTGPQQIMNLKGHLVFGSKMPKYGALDFNRMNPISKKMSDDVFLSKYPRQTEVSIAGSVDPDAVMRVEFQDVKVKSVAQNTGENIAGDTDILKKRVLLRDEKDPSKIVLQEFQVDEKGVETLTGEKIYRISNDNGTPSINLVQ